MNYGNGNGITPRPEQFLGKAQTARYKPNAFVHGGIWGGMGSDEMWFTRGDVWRMDHDPRIRFGYRILTAPIRKAKWVVKAPDQRVANFVVAQMKRFWRTSLSHALSMVKYGEAGGEWMYQSGPGNQIKLDRLKPLHAMDLTPLELDGELYGVRVKTLVRPDGQPLDLCKPKAAWFVHDPAEGNPFWGRSRYRGAWNPWQEKVGRHGARDIRRMWYLRNAFHGGTLRYPPGVVDLGDGTTMSNQDYARQLLELMETGGNLCLPGDRDEASGEYLWVFEPAAINGGAEDIREYPRDLDRETFEGLEIPEEIVQAAESGSGYAGRSVPAQVFYVSLDELVDSVVSTFDRQCLRPLVDVNFGPGADYEVEPESLVPSDPPPDQQPGNRGMQDLIAGQGGKPDQAGPKPPPSTAPGATPVALSLDDAGHEHKGKGEGGGQFTAHGEGEVGGREGEGKGGKEAAKPATPPHHATVAGWLEKANLPDELKNHYHKTATAVLDKMPDGLRIAALASLAEWGGKVSFYPDIAGVTAALEAATGKKEKAKVGGWVHHHANGEAVQMHLDGGAGEGVGDTAEGIYAHELGHCVDVDRKYSSDPKWESAWKKEIKGGKVLLSRYAMTSATEGFGELHRAIVQKGVEAVKAVYPKCIAFLEGKGLL